MPDLTNDLQRYGAALTARVPKVDVDLIMAGISVDPTTPGPPRRQRALVIALAAAFIAIALAVAVLTSGGTSTEVGTVGQPDGPGGTVVIVPSTAGTGGNAANTSIPPSAGDLLRYGGTAELTPAMLAAFRRFDLPSGVTFVPPSRTELITEDQLISMLSFQTACAWYGSMAEGFDSGSDPAVTAAISALQRLLAQPEGAWLSPSIDPVIADAQNGSRTGLDRQLEINC